MKCVILIAQTVKHDTNNKVMGLFPVKIGNYKMYILNAMPLALDYM